MRPVKQDMAASSLFPFTRFTNGLLSVHHGKIRRAIGPRRVRSTYFHLLPVSLPPYPPPRGTLAHQSAIPIPPSSLPRRRVDGRNAPKRRLEAVLGLSWAAFGASLGGQDGPRCAQDAPRCPQDAPRRAQDAPRRPQDAPSTTRDPSRTPPGPQKSLIFLTFL